MVHEIFRLNAEVDKLSRASGEGMKSVLGSPSATEN